MSDRIRRAVDRLTEALHELGYTDRLDLNPDVRILLAPRDGVPGPVQPAGLTAELAELLADMIEDLISERAARSLAEHDAAGMFAATHPDLASAITTAFTGIDLCDLTRTVLNDTTPQNRMAVTRALDSMFGDVTDQEAEDDE